MTARRLFGSAVLAGLALLVALGFSRPDVRHRLGRVLGAMAHDAFVRGGEGDVRFALADPGGIRRGDPVFLEARATALRPVAYVTAVGTDGVRVRAAPGETLPEGRVLERLAPPYGLRDALDMAVPEPVRARLAASFDATLRGLLAEAILPEVRRRLPAFLERVDPRTDEEARQVLDAVGGEVLERLRPLGDELARQVADDVKERFDFLERVGLLWDLLRGDAEALREQVTPVALKSAADWWEANQEAVLTRVGEGIAARLPELQRWALDDVLPAARDEIASPVIEAQAGAIEAAADRLVRRVADDVVEAPEGGFRLRFRSVLRTRLLEKDEPLLLLVEPAE